MNTREIKIKVHDESEIFCPMDPDQLLLSTDVSEYLARCYVNKHRKRKEDYVIHIFSDVPVDEEHVKHGIVNYCEQRKSNINHDLKIEV